MEALTARVLLAVRASVEPLDDDELAERLHVQPRQTINQICRRLVRQGVLDRIPGPWGKLVNVAISSASDEASGLCRCGCGQLTVRAQAAYVSGHDARHASAVASQLSSHTLTAEERQRLLASLRTPALRAKAESILGRREQTPIARTNPSSGEDDLRIERGAEDEVPAGDSTVQREAERSMLDILANQLGVELTVGHISAPGGSRVEVDGADKARSVLVEAWAHQGPPKSAQRHKVLADAFKLVWIAKSLPIRPRLILLMSDVAAARPFTYGRSWAAEAIRNLGIEVIVVEMAPEIRMGIRRAQERQFR